MKTSYVEFVVRLKVKHSTGKALRIGVLEMKEFLQGQSLVGGNGTDDYQVDIKIGKTNKGRSRK